VPSQSALEHTTKKRLLAHAGRWRDDRQLPDCPRLENGPHASLEKLADPLERRQRGVQQPEEEGKQRQAGKDPSQKSRRHHCRLPNSGCRAKRPASPPQKGAITLQRIRTETSSFARRKVQRFPAPFKAAWAEACATISGKEEPKPIARWEISWTAAGDRGRRSCPLPHKPPPVRQLSGSRARMPHQNSFSISARTSGAKPSGLGLKYLRGLG
jgi:hypothetical protein